MPTHTGRVGDRPKSILEDTPEGYAAFTDGAVEGIGTIGIFGAELDQLPH